MDRNKNFTDLKLHDLSIDAIKSKYKFVIFGENHSSAATERSVFSSLIPEMSRHNIKVIAFEDPPGMNGFYAHLQVAIRHHHLSVSEVSHRVNAAYHRHGFENPEIDALPKMAEIVVAATKHGIKVVGIDPTADDPNFMKRMHTGVQIDENGNWDANDALGYDASAAKIASHILGKERKDSRMAILYGFGHSKAGGIPFLDRPPILSESLEKYGSVRTISLATGGMERSAAARNYKIINNPLVDSKIEKEGIEIFKELAEFNKKYPDANKIVEKYIKSHPSYLRQQP